MARNVDLLNVAANDLKRFAKESAFVIDETLPDLRSSLEEAKSQSRFEFLIYASFRVVSDSALGLVSAKVAQTCAAECVAATLAYFKGDWTKVAQSREDRRCVEKKPTNKDLSWLQVFVRGFLAALLLDDKEGVVELANWPEAWMEKGFLPSNSDDPLVAKVYISIAAGFRTVPLKGQEEMEAKIGKSRAKLPKLLFQAWSAARSGDSANFDKSFKESLDQFEKTIEPPRISDDLIALNQSLLLAAALAKGVPMPDLTPRQRARLITRDCLGKK